MAPMNKKILLIAVLGLLIVSCMAQQTSPTARPEQTQPPVRLPQRWWDQAVFYEIFVRSFNDSDGNGVGDFNGITQKLDYLQGLGVNALWLMPIFPSPSYHGYDVTDYYTVNPQYGTLEDFKVLLQEAHKRDIRIILDLVINHTSDKHTWFKQAKDPASPYRNWYIWSETDPKYKGPWGERVWHPSASGFYYGIFEAFMPDLNYNNPEVTDEMLKITRFWLSDIGVDGFRLDAAKHLIEDGIKQENSQATHAWYQDKFYPAIKQTKPDAMTIGELFGDGFNTIGSYIKNDQLDLAFNFQLASSFLKAANSGKAGGLMAALQTSEKAIPENQYGTFLTNHDQNRVMSQLGEDVNKAKLAAFLMLTSPGVPFIYYGEEIGVKGGKPDENIRLPMQWSAEKNAGFTTGRPWRAPAPDYPDVNTAGQTAVPGSLLEHYRALIHLRRAHSALQTGATIMLKSNLPGVYAVLRRDDQGTLLILANLTDQTIEDYRLAIKDTDLSGFTMESIFSSHPADVLQWDGASLEDFKPFDSLQPFAMYILRLNHR